MLRLTIHKTLTKCDERNVLSLTGTNVTHLIMKTTKPSIMKGHGDNDNIIKLSILLIIA